MSSFTKYDTEKCSIFKYRQRDTTADNYPDELNKHGLTFGNLYEAMAKWNQDQQVSKFGANGKTDTGGVNLDTGNQVIQKMNWKENGFYDKYLFLCIIQN